VSPQVREQILDVGEVIRLRLARGLSIRRLAVKSGVSPTLIRGLERGHNHAMLNLRFLTRLAAALEVPPEALLRPELRADSIGDDDVRVEAALAMANRAIDIAEIAGALGWSMKRSRDAITALAARVDGTGQVLIDAGWRKVQLVPAPLPPAEALKVRQLSARSRGLTVSTGRALRDFLAGRMDDEWHRRAGNAQRTALSELMSIGILQKDPKEPGKITLAPEFGFLVASRAMHAYPVEPPTWDPSDDDGPSYVVGADTFMSFHR
jgi:transcriptional regulator with XRE-family HTH domain